MVVPVGLLVYGWAAEYTVHWIVPNVGTCLVAFASLTNIQAIQLYIMDYYTENSASALAALNTAKYLTGAFFPLFAPPMYAGLGYGWGNTLLAIISIVVGIPVPLLLLKYGERLRKKSPFAVKQDETQDQV